MEWNYFKLFTLFPYLGVLIEEMERPLSYLEV